MLLLECVKATSYDNPKVESLWVKVKTDTFRKLFFDQF